jgi:hypothetical protein
MRLALLAVAALLAGRAAAGGAQPPSAPDSVRTASSGLRVQAGTLVRPDTVDVGDPFTFVVTVAVPAEARVEWPTITDSAAVVAMRGPVRIIDEGTKRGMRRERAEYELAAWDVGSLPLGLDDAVVRYGSTTLRVPLADARVMVRSVLPGDTTLHVPKPARALFPRVVPWWQQWWPWRRRRRIAAAAPVTPLDPYLRAQHDFERLERLALADAGEAGRAVALALDVLRLYLVARVPTARLSLTSGEVLDVLAADERVPHDRLRSLLIDADSIKFAARIVSPSRAREMAAEARALVEAIEQAEVARRAAETAAREAAREAALAAEAAARREAEEAARKASRQPSRGARGPKAGV